MSFWIRGSSSGHIDFSNDIVAILNGESLSAVAINSGGTGYTVGDILTVAGGTANIAAQVEVTSVSGGVIDGVRIYNAGSYSANPTTTANAVTGGTGSSATMDLTMADVGWTVDRDQVWDGGSEREVIAHGEGGGSDAIYVGWRTFSSVGGDYYNWELHGMTGYTSGLPINEQPGVSNGDHEAGTPQDEGCYYLLSSTSFNWFLNINSYRMILTANVGSNYWHVYMGWGNRFGTASEYPYPLVISAPSIFHDANTSLSSLVSSIVDPWMQAGSSTYPCGTVIYKPGGSWIQCMNRRLTSPFDDCCVVPTQRPQVGYTTPAAPEDLFMTQSYRAFYDIIYSNSTGTGGTTAAALQTTGDNDDHLMLPAIVVESIPEIAILLEFDECRWCNNFGSVSSEDRFIESDGTAWRIFKNGNRNDTYAYMAIKEAD